MSFHHTAPSGSAPLVVVALLVSSLAAIVKMAEAFTFPRGAPPAPTSAAGRRRTAASIGRDKETQWERSCASPSFSSSPSTSVSSSMAFPAMPLRPRTQPPAGDVGSFPSGIGGEPGGSRVVQSRNAKATSSAGASTASSCERTMTAVVRNRAQGEEKGNRALEKKLQGDLKRFAELRMWRQALTAFDKARADGVPLISATYTQVINVMSKGGRWKEAIDLLEEMIAGGRGGVSPSVVSYNAAISACARGRKPDLALGLLEDMWRRSGIRPDRYSYAAALSALARTGKPARAVMLLDEMREGGVVPDAVCFVAAMEACENRGSWREAGLVLEQVRAAEPPLPLSSLTTILTSAVGSCVAEGAWERAIEYLSDLRAGNPSTDCVLPPPAAAYAAAANACARAGQGLRARALIAELAELAAEEGGSGEKPTIECYNAVIAGCAIAGDIEGALRTLREEVPRAGLKANTKSYNHLLAGCARSGRWETALVLLEEQRSGKPTDAPANRESYNAALDACGRAGQVSPALDLLEVMRAASVSNRRLRPDRYSYGGALQACRAAGDSSTALRLLKTMDDEGVRADQACSLAAVATCTAEGRGAEAADVLEGMVAARVSTSNGARALAREACMEESGGGARRGFERALAALDALDAAATERSVAERVTKGLPEALLNGGDK